MDVVSAEIIKTEYKNGIKNTYKLEYTDYGDIIISNVNRSLDHLVAGTREDIKITNYTGDLNEWVHFYLGPHAKSIHIDENDYDKDSFGMFVYYGLDGKVKAVGFAHSAEVQAIPLEVLEELEEKIEKEHQLYLKYRIQDVEYFQYFGIYYPYSLIDIGDEELLKENPSNNNNGGVKPPGAGELLPGQEFIP